MRLDLHSFAATTVAVLFFVFPARAVDMLPDAEPCAADLPAAMLWYDAIRPLPADAGHGRRIVVAVDLSASPGFSVDGRLLRYRMLFNDVAEGWSWQPLARPGEADYYRWKYLPLGSLGEELPAYVQEEKIGEPQRTRVQWRYDYFLAFDNAYDFYRRTDDDETGFSLLLPEGVVGERPVRLHAIARLGEPATSESTTYWKAIYARPVDFTLKKRYLVGRLEALVVCAAEGGEMARIVPLPDAAARADQR